MPGLKPKEINSEVYTYIEIIFEFYRMVTLQGDDIASIPLEEVAGKLKLVTEDHRLWDARRWMIAADNEKGKGVLNIPLRGLEILNRGGVPSYTPIEIEKRNFEPKMYLYPIPQGDLDIAGWSQNPLW